MLSMEGTLTRQSSDVLDGLGEGENLDMVYSKIIGTW